VLARGRIYHDDTGEPMRMAGTVLDITESKRAEETLRRANRAKDEFLAMLGHELRNPLGAIVGAVNVLNIVGKVGETAERARAVIGRQVEHLSRLVDDLLDMSRVTSGKVMLSLQPLDLAELVVTTIGAWRAAGRLDRHDVSATVTPVWVMGDEARLEQVLSNLAGNALK
jgi:signal transduction histidine kinase